MVVARKHEDMKAAVFYISCRLIIDPVDDQFPDDGLESVVNLSVYTPLLMSGRETVILLIPFCTATSLESRRDSIQVHQFNTAFTVCKDNGKLP